MNNPGLLKRKQRKIDFSCKKLEEELKTYSDSDIYPFHMPGHKRQKESCFPALDSAVLLDITEIDGFDNLHAPEGILREEMLFAAQLFGAKETFFSVNGSTGAILAAISAAAPKGSEILIERSCHISIYHAAYLRGLKLKFIGEDSAPKGPLAAVVITSPSYEGYVKDVRAWARYAHTAGALLIVDEAHGAHFSMHPDFPVSAIRCGADLVVQSLHKTLPALTQTALLHKVTDRVDSRQIQRFLDIYETSSPSYVLMASITGCLHRMAEEGSSYFSAYVQRLKTLRKTLADSLSCLHLEGQELLPASYDPGKLLLSVPAPHTGKELYHRLREEYQLQPEMYGNQYVLLMTSAADTEEGFLRLEKALLEIDAQLTSMGENKTAGSSHFLPDRVLLPPAVMSLAEAADAPKEYLPLERAQGCVCGDYVIAYPPDSPLIVPGELFTSEIINEICQKLRQSPQQIEVSVVNEGHSKRQ